MDAIIAQFLHFARGSNDETPEWIDLDALISDLAEAYARRGMPVILQLGGCPLLLRRQGLLRAIGNLIENAHRYGARPIEVLTWQTSQAVGIDVLDRGPGIPVTEIEHLKRPFTRLESARSNACGTGLGLAIVERVARLHGGSLELLPRDGGGLIARLRLPRSSQE